MKVSHCEKQVIRTRSKSIKNIRQILGEMKVGWLAKKIGATKRKERKCSVTDILIGYWELIATNQFSYDSWAGRVSGLIKGTISGQAIHKRINNCFVVFLKQLLEKSFQKKLEPMFGKELFSSFANVLIQDATHFSLPRSLAAAFPGSHSRYGESATAKIQAVFNLTKGFFCDLRIFCFRDNDQKDAPHIVSILNKGDLIIRDLGYFILDSFIAIKNKGAHFLSRFRYGMTVYDPDTGKQINLLKYLKKHGRIDMDVEIGIDKRVKCRLVAIALPQSVATERMRKAKANRNKRANHSKEYFSLLRYSIYITTVASDIWTPGQLAEAYRCRWYIEILFKSWKSGLSMKFNIPDRYADPQRAEFFLYAGLLLVSLVVMPIFIRATVTAAELGHSISILKTCSFIIQEILTLTRSKRLDRLLDQVIYYCAYERRKSRVNAIEMMMLSPC